MLRQSAIKVILASACIFGVGQSIAQTPAPGQPAGKGPGAQHGHQAHRGHAGQPGQTGPRGFSKPSERVEARLAYQKTALKITDAQLPQWNAYAEQARKTARDMDQRMADMQQRRGEMQQRGNTAQPGQHPGAIEGLERRQSMHAEAIRRINEQLAVQKPLYAALSPDQQKIADAVLGHAGRQGMKGMHGGRGMHGKAGMGESGGRAHGGSRGHGGHGSQGGQEGHRGHMMRSEGPSVQS